MQIEKTKDFWQESRHEELTKTEAGIIKMIDTLTNAPAFQRLTKTINFIATGYLSLGNFQIGPWYQLDYRQWLGRFPDAV